MSKNLVHATRRLFPILILLWLAGCGGGSNDNASGGVAAAPATPGASAGSTNYTVGGAVSGLLGTVVLQNNGGDDLSLSANTGFTFATIAATGSNYSVTVRTQPASQTCTVANGAGTVSEAGVTNVTVTCSSPLPSLALFAGVMKVGNGSVDGAGAAARFSGPEGVATDSAGNIYVADSADSVIRKITPAGAVTTLAGTARFTGSTDATGAAARFYSPRGVATDGAGNVYVADTTNQTIRKITPAGIVTTLAGTAGVTGSTDATGAAASFFNPFGIATDSAGNVYVTDLSNSTIRKITSAGVVTTLAGTAGVIGSTDATGAAASFMYPRGVATDSAGNVYVADDGNNTIRKITSAGVVTTLAGTAGVIGSTDATGAAASFHFPEGVATDSAGNVYVADLGNSTIRKITPAGAVSTLAGTAGSVGSTDATGAAASFFGARGVATDSARNVYVADLGNSTIRKITPSGVVTTLAGSGVTGRTDATGTAARFNRPAGLATDSAGNVYLVDSGNNIIRKITPAGVVTTLADTAGMPCCSTGATGPEARPFWPTGVAIDSADNVYVVDFLYGMIHRITPAGVVTTLNDATGAVARFALSRGIATDSAGNIYVANWDANAIAKITPGGVVTQLSGPQFNFPANVATDGAGNVYTEGNHTILKITPAGVVTTLAGTAGVTGSTDATGAAASFNFPSGIATDSAGNVYVADTGNHTIRKITPAGVVSTVVGVAGQEGFAPGALPGLLSSPVGVAVSGTSLYITLLNGVAVVQNLP